jgi:PPP family 3-phenylpropionic acid transporter
MAPATRLRLFYFLYYGGVGAYLPYFAPYLRGLGFSGEQIGAAQMVAPLVAAPAALTWAAAADRSGAPVRLLRLATIWAALAASLLPLAGTPWPVAGVLLAWSMGGSAVVPLADAVTLEWCRENPATSYARIRLFGSLGFVALSVAMGAALTARGDRPGDLLVPASVAACVVGYALVARRLPAGAPRLERPGLREMSGLLGDRGLLLLLLVCALHWGATAPYHLLFGVLVRDLGLPSEVTGLGMGVGVAAEVAALLAFPRLERGLSLRALFAAAFAGSAVRWWLVSRLTGAAGLVAVQALHGLTFGLFWATAMKAMSELVPVRLRATGQALFTAVVFGGGNALGYGLSGMGYDRLGGAPRLFAGAALAELLPLALALLALGRPAARPGEPGPRA